MNLFKGCFIYQIENQEKFCSKFSNFLEFLYKKDIVVSVTTFDINKYFPISNIKEIQLYNEEYFLSANQVKQKIKIMISPNFFLLLINNTDLLLDSINEIEEFFINEIKSQLITDKKLISFLLDSNFTENILEFKISEEDIDDYYDDVYYGSDLQHIFVFQNVLLDVNLSFVYLKFQPLTVDCTFTLRSPNIISIKGNIDLEQTLTLFAQFCRELNKYENIEKERCEDD